MSAVLCCLRSQYSRSAEGLEPQESASRKLPTIKLGKLEEIHVPHVGVREGVILDLVADATIHADREDRREQGVRNAAINFGRRFMLGESHTLHVAKLALSLLTPLGVWIDPI